MILFSEYLAPFIASTPLSLSRGSPFPSLPLMFSIDDAHALTLEELTWLSASTLIENQHVLSVCHSLTRYLSTRPTGSHIASKQESPSPDRDSRALFNTVFSDSHSELAHVRISSCLSSSAPSHALTLDVTTCPILLCHSSPPPSFIPISVRQAAHHSSSYAPSSSPPSSSILVS